MVQYLIWPLSVLMDSSGPIGMPGLIIYIFHLYVIGENCYNGISENNIYNSLLSESLGVISEE